MDHAAATKHLIADLDGLQYVSSMGLRSFLSGPRKGWQSESGSLMPVRLHRAAPPSLWTDPAYRLSSRSSIRFSKALAHTLMDSAAQRLHSARQRGIRGFVSRVPCVPGAVAAGVPADELEKLDLVLEEILV